MPGGFEPENETSFEIVGIPKGLAVRLALIVALNDTDQRGVEHRENTFIVQIDGSGAFHYNSILCVTESLIGNNRQIVLGARTGDWFMPGRERKPIERFENSIVAAECKRSLSADYNLIDGQAGCWGIRASVLKTLALTALDYELEFDLLASALLAGFPPIYSMQLFRGKRIGHPVSGELDYSDPRKTLRKVPFILHKLGWNRQMLAEFIDQYERDHGTDTERALPAKYLAQLRAWIGTA
jgi:hypothetical protein